MFRFQPRFVASDLQKLSAVLQRALSVPVHGDSTPFILPVGEVALTPLQEAILSAVKVMQAVSSIYVSISVSSIPRVVSSTIVARKFTIPTYCLNYLLCLMFMLLYSLNCWHVKVVIIVD